MVRLDFLSDHLELTFYRRLRYMISVGVDIGSRTTKAVVLDDGQNGQGNKILGDAIIETGINPISSGERVLEEALSNAGVSRKTLGKIVATGYGRISARFADKTITEITCHARGVHHMEPSVCTIIDIGGQDSKVIKLDDRGRVQDFVMNDRCAAGTGKFLEVMSRAMETVIEEFSQLFFEAGEPCAISSMCTVFAESEVISLLADGHNRPDIIAGLHLAVAKRVANMALRLGLEEGVAFTGGVAKNQGMVAALEQELETSFTPLSYEPQLIGALGAALLARKLK